MSKRSTNFSGMGGKNGRYANSIQGLVDAMRAVGYTDAEIRAELLKMQAEQSAALTPAPAAGDSTHLPQGEHASGASAAGDGVAQPSAASNAAATCGR